MGDCELIDFRTWVTKKIIIFFCCCCCRWTKSSENETKKELRLIPFCISIDWSTEFDMSNMDCSIEWRNTQLTQAQIWLNKYYRWDDWILKWLLTNHNAKFDFNQDAKSGKRYHFYARYLKNDSAILDTSFFQLDYSAPCTINIKTFSLSFFLYRKSKATKTNSGNGDLLNVIKLLY